MRIGITIFALATLAVAAAFGVIYSGFYNVAATEPHFPAVRWALDTALHRSVQAHAEGIVSPPLDDEEGISSGARNYASMCAICHGRPGEELPAMAKGMRPQPPHLGEAASRWAANEIFWIVKNGIKMTGMPSWGSERSDEELWSLVAFVERMPQMSAKDYQALITKDRDQQEQSPDEPQTAATGEQQSQDQQPSGDGSQSDDAQQAESGQPQSQDQRPSEDGEQSDDAQQSANGQQQAEQQTQDEQPAGGAESGPAAVIEMNSKMDYVPATLTIKVGDTVEWKNVSDVAHTVTAMKDKARDNSHVKLPDGAEPFDSGFIQGGKSWSYTFTVPGQYTYFCIPHEAAGMVAELTVEEE